MTELKFQMLNNFEYMNKTVDNTVVFTGPCGESKVTLEFLQDVHKYQGVETVKNALYLLYASVVDSEFTNSHVEVKSDGSVKLVKNK